MNEKTLLSFFWDLASTNETTRVDTAINLINHLQSCDRAFEKNEEIEDSKSDDLKYTLNRLVKGLASSRKAARQGFAMALIEIVLLFDSISVEDILELMKESLTVTKNSSAQEERDAYIGQIFGLFIIGRAVCLAKNQKNERIELSSINLIIENLKELSTKKSYLQETCYKAIVDLVSMLQFSDFHQHILPILENDLKCKWERYSPDCLFLVLTLLRLFKHELKGKYFKKSWTNPNFDSKESYPILAKILQNSHNAHPRVHIVWQEVFSFMLMSEKADFKKFWLIVVDENLFQSSHERKFLGFKLLEKVLPMLSVDQVEIVFSPQLMRCLFNSLAHDTNYLYPATKQMMESIGSGIIQQEKQELISAVVMQLLTRNGNICFDAITKTKTVENLIPKLRLEDLPDLISCLKEMFVTTDKILEDTEDSGTQLLMEKKREGVLNLFSSLIRCKQLNHTKSWVLDVVYFVFENAYFVKLSSTPLSPRTRVLCQQRFKAILGELASLPQNNTEAILYGKISESTVQGKRHGYADDGRLWISHIMQHAKELIQNRTSAISVEIPWDNEAHKVFKKTLKIVKKLEKKTNDLSPEENAFILMFLYVGVELFVDVKQAKEILEDLFHCYENVTTKTSTDSQEENEPHWMDVVTEILLSLITESSNFRRQVVDQVFNIIVPHLTSSSLKIILEAVHPRSGLYEDTELHSEENEDFEQEKQLQEESDDDSESDDLSDDDIDDDAKDPVDPLLKIDLQAALGNAAVNEKDGDSDESGQSESDLDDDDMMQLDEALSEIFKQRLRTKHDKKKVEDARKTLLHFKLRVLDLVEILVKKRPKDEIILELIQPLLEVIHVCLADRDSKTLGERAKGIFKNKLCSIKKAPHLSSSYIENVHMNIEFLLEQAKKAPSVTMVTLLSSGCLFLIRQLRGNEEANCSNGKKTKQNSDERLSESKHINSARVIKAYGEALEDFMLHRSTNLHPVIFQELVSRFPDIGWGLAEDLVTYITKGINNFRKIQACAMLSQLISRTAHFKDNRIKSIAKPLQEAFQLVFVDSSSPNTELKAKHLRQILKLAAQFVKQLKADSEEQVGQKIKRKTKKEAQ
ncbi:rDNA transcriptional regulator pol5-like isoform X2 [Xenia sp. Carnegie-2017]|uniref:rDNA transcriptional regulator pol5-like isoform X2 n=1 Tax=Xenia sp. Carnegie-2017 TaxID=2897299 RepID=UPI001F044B56|nr:rDNA transcriptional regulator pol5-like isoform X2 [Xenia sp. Carnegie-2017]